MIYDNSYKIERLFDTLQTTKEENQINKIEGMILSLWQNTGNDLLNSIIVDGLILIENRKLDEAYNLFTQLIRIAPWHPEGWNKRATVAYMMGNYKRAIMDIEETLEREPRQFEALSGLATIYEELLLPRKALKVLNKLKKIAPHRDRLHKQIRGLKNQSV